MRKLGLAITITVAIGATILSLQEKINTGEQIIAVLLALILQTLLTKLS